MEKQERENVEQLHFELIASLWREREGLPFVSRQELHDEIAERHEIPDDDEDDEDEEPEDDGDGMEEEDCSEPSIVQLAHDGIDLALDDFAKSGPDREAFHRISGHREEPSSYWRYKIERGGVIGYAPLQNLTPEEITAIANRLQREGEEAMREGNALQQRARADWKN
jgi:hypothetical protein